MDDENKNIAAQLQARLRMEAFLGNRYVNFPGVREIPRLQVNPGEMRPGAPLPAETPAASARADYDAAPSPDGGFARFAACPPTPPAAVIPDRPLASTSHVLAAPGREHVQQTLPLLSGTPEQLPVAHACFADVLKCQNCGLCQTRRQAVFGEGNLQAAVMFVSEAPGKDEDFLGRPFISTAGEFLTDIIEKGMKIRRADVFITNILKCRPPGNRDPEPGETAACLPFLERQIDLVRPQVIVAVGRTAGNLLSGQNRAPGELRGQWFTYRGIPLTTIYHPSFLLRQRRSLGRGNQYDRDTWADIQAVMRRLVAPEA